MGAGGQRVATDIRGYRSAGGAICHPIRVIRWFGDFSSKWIQFRMPVASKKRSLSIETELCDEAGSNPNIATLAVLLSLCDWNLRRRSPDSTGPASILKTYPLRNIEGHVPTCSVCA